MGFISLSRVFEENYGLIEVVSNINSIENKPIFSVTLALLSTLLLGLNINIVKYFDRKGFPSDVFAYSCYGFTNLI
jgi:drug/metabolite transporter (DMT)-like permease